MLTYVYKFYRMNSIINSKNSEIKNWTNPDLEKCIIFLNGFVSKL